MRLATPLKLTGTPKLPRLHPILAAILGGVAIALTTAIAPVLADPFRANTAHEPHEIDDQVELAFDSIFKQGDYQGAAEILRSTNTNEPLAFGIKAALAYLDEDWDALGENATLTLQKAEQLVETDPLRGHLYIAAGHFLEGAYVVSTEGLVAGTPTALSKLQLVFANLEEAEKINPDDPELNLLRGFMDLMLAVNLPFADPNKAIERLQNYGSPAYLVDRGIALGYRDLDQPDLALQAVDRALAATPDNPDLYYLKAQILVLQGKDKESLRFFRRAAQNRDRMPQGLANQLSWEQCRAANRANNTNRNCSRRLEG